MGTCSSCGNEKQLTVHGTCWKCHVGGLQVGKKVDPNRPIIEVGGCKDCGKNPDIYRVKKDITAKVEVRPV